MANRRTGRVIRAERSARTDRGCWSEEDEDAVRDANPEGEEGNRPRNPVHAATLERDRGDASRLGDERLRPAVVLRLPHASAFVFRPGSSGLELDLAPGVVNERFEREAARLPAFEHGDDVVSRSEHERDLGAVLEGVQGARVDRDACSVPVDDRNLGWADPSPPKAEPGEHFPLDHAPSQGDAVLVTPGDPRRLLIDAGTAGTEPRRELTDPDARLVELS